MGVRISNKQLIELLREGTLAAGDMTYTVVEEGDWDGAGEKYQTLEVIFTDGERNYSGYVTRSGSYFSDWNYNDFGNADIDEVERVTRTVTVNEYQPVLERGHAIYEAGAEEMGWYCVNDAELAALITELRAGDTESPDSDFVTIIGSAVRTASGWYAPGLETEAAN